MFIIYYFYFKKSTVTNIYKDISHVSYIKTYYIFKIINAKYQPNEVRSTRIYFLDPVSLVLE